jgi:hypothetical protein
LWHGDERDADDFFAIVGEALYDVNSYLANVLHEARKGVKRFPFPPIAHLTDLTPYLRQELLRSVVARHVYSILDAVRQETGDFKCDLAGKTAGLRVI